MSSTNPKTYEASTPRKAAFLGLGVMGYPMAGHLALAGHQVTVYNRSAAKSAAWCAEFEASSQPTSAESPRLAAADA
ncbi:NAD(P)-binding domain-containing protein, partial [Polaromonas sp. UBA4122]|uniref:NAD(P)-binding domain-containing protein n=1 Tax=Polaromonas sp. UBA4122 TaxID=1947074 RepID=UPI0025FCC983